MPYVVIENFRHGLDGRRLNLTSVLGTLEVLQDGYINQGGEIEKRKAFVPTDITPTVASGVTATYGIQPLADSIVIFGAEENADEDNWPPAGFTYQRLYRDLAADAAADVCDTDNTPNYCAECEGWSDAIGVTDVIYSSSFGGKTFVIAEMSDGIVNCFYDGEIITDINAFGRRLTGMDSLLKLYCSWVKNLNGVTGYTGDIFDEAGELGILVTGTTHRRFHVLHPTTPGTICQASIVIADVSEPEIGLPGSVSSGFFTIFDGAPNGTTNQITSVKVGVTELLGSAVSFVGNVFDTATAVATEINAGVHAFNAIARGNIIAIYADDNGTTHNGKALEAIVTSGIMIGSCEIEFNGVTFVLEHIQVDGLDILNGVDYTFPTASESLQTYAARVATGINAATGTTGYIALARQNVLKFCKKTSRSDDAATGTDTRPAARGMLPVSILVTGNGQADESDSAPLAVTIEPAPCEMYYNVSELNGNTYYSYRRGFTKKNLKALVLGGVAPYKYYWEPLDQNWTSLHCQTPTAIETQIYDGYLIQEDHLADGTAVSRRRGNIKVTVTDSKGSTGSAVIPCTFYLE